MPKFRHGDFEFEVNDAWWAEAGMVGFVPASSSYRAGPREARLGLEALPLVVIPVVKVAPLRRQLSHGVFNDGEKPARERVKDILSGFRRGDAIPPVQVVRLADGSLYTHRLFNGAHRFYCAVAAGYSHVPAVEVRGAFDDL